MVAVSVPGVLRRAAVNVLRRSDRRIRVRQRLREVTHLAARAHRRHTPRNRRTSERNQGRENRDVGAVVAVNRAAARGPALPNAQPWRRDGNGPRAATSARAAIASSATTSPAGFSTSIVATLFPACQ